MVRNHLLYGPHGGRQMILPEDLALERCLVTNLLTSLTPRALQLHTIESLSENLKNTGWRLCGWWRSDAQVSNKNTQKLREDMLCRTVLKVHTPLAMSRNENVPLQILLSLPL